MIIKHRERVLAFRQGWRGQVTPQQEAELRMGFEATRPGRCRQKRHDLRRALLAKACQKSAQEPVKQPPVRMLRLSKGRPKLVKMPDGIPCRGLFRKSFQQCALFIGHIEAVDPIRQRQVIACFQDNGLPAVPGGDAGSRLDRLDAENRRPVAAPIHAAQDISLGPFDIDLQEGDLLQPERIKQAGKAPDRPHFRAETGAEQSRALRIGLHDCGKPMQPIDAVERNLAIFCADEQVKHRITRADLAVKLGQFGLGLDDKPMPALEIEMVADIVGHRMAAANIDIDAVRPVAQGAIQMIILEKLGIGQIHRNFPGQAALSA